MSPRRAGTLVILATAGILAGLGASLLYRNLAWNRLVEPVGIALSSASAQGMVYPHAEPMTPQRKEIREAEDFEERLKTSIERLQERFEADESYSPRTAYWLGAGMILTGRLPTARAAVDIARVHHPYDQDLWILDAILTEAEGDRELASERLETLLDRFPENDLARENLALLRSP